MTNATLSLLHRMTPFLNDQNQSISHLSLWSRNKTFIKIRKKLTTIVINIAANKWLPNIGQNKLWWEVHSYKGLTSIFEEVASELLFGLAVKCLEIQLFWLKKIKTFTKNIGVPICLDIYLRLQYSKFWAILKHFFFLLRYIATNDLYLFLKKLPLSSCLA